MAEEPTSESERSISRAGLELVIRRAIDISLSEQDAKDQLSESELIKIAEELGLSERHVRQALYERPHDEPVPDAFLDRYFGPASVVALRAVPCEVVTAHARLEDYLVTREYLQIRRRQGPNAFFEPADDAFSSIARAFSRPSGRFHIARVQRAYLTVRPLDSGWCHVRLQMSYPEQRKGQATTAILAGSLFGVLTGGLVAGAVGSAISTDVLQIAAAAVTGVVSGGGVFVGVWAAFRKEYQKWLGRSRDEAEAVLDRLEHGDDLRPPTSPWLRRLQSKLRGLGSNTRR
ncbi:MAG: hypothetical protein WEE89_03635 [Gemmatimonadota bacterium]